GYPSPGCRHCYSMGSALLSFGVTLAVDGEPVGQGLHLATNGCLHGTVIVIAIGLESIKDLKDQLADFTEFRFAKAAGGARRRAKTDARGDCRLFRIKRNGVFVAGDVRTAE